METLEAIHTRRSVRAFTRQPVPEGLLRRVGALRALAPGVIGRPTALIAIGLDVERAGGIGGALGLKLAWIDIGLAMQNLLLAAHDLGLAACPVGSFHRAAVALFLDLPPHIQPVLLIGLGYPEVKPPSRGRRPLGEACFAERWGEPL